MIQVGEHLAMAHPPPEVRQHYNVGEHRLVKAYEEGEPDPGMWDWMCFDHGWDCWATAAAKSRAPFEVEFVKDIEMGTHPEDMDPPDRG